ncbi:nucleoside monophosphate kinase [Opitutus terrae]|uniref:Adenylate kinase n=1 Tax=Opitutus terrae (strain DSM 11246 / JCM 15787 / PB90-1) TaxID=452637 RepID=B1ZUP2_OPITP|nr:nucleoside monophosphate kinase [Opitutus terrae]ACB74926.1 putative adenylate kinase [Opitutus terrae PB90-1]
MSNSRYVAPSAQASASSPTAGKITDLEIKDAQLIFGAAWEALEAEFGRENLRFPKEILLLGGAPGAGKGTNTAFIAKARGLTCPPIVMSALLDSPEARRLKDAGNMVGDREVVSLLLRELMKPIYRDGVILDGFPRTRVQVECLKMLVDKMHALRREFFNTPLSIHFRQPTVHIMVLFVDEKESIARQLKRGRQTIEHNEEVKRTGVGELWEDRPTDHDEMLAQRRYRVFKEQTWDALQSLKEIFHYHFINAQGPIGEVEQNIVKELEYQSTLELDPRTVDRLRILPVASEIIVHSRQELVKRLDSYEFGQPELFSQVVGFVARKIMPVVLRHSISGVALFNTQEPLLEDPTALAMLIDVFSERGYHAVVDIHRIEIPEKFDLQTGQITCRVKKVFRIQIRFQGSEIRRG